MCFFVPEWEDDQASDNEDRSKHYKDVVTGISPPSIVEHLCRLSEGGRKKDMKVQNKWITYLTNE